MSSWRGRTRGWTAWGVAMAVVGYAGSARGGGAAETVDPGWEVANVGAGVKPSFDFDGAGRIHIMGMTETSGGVVWHGVAEDITGPWATNQVAVGYFYGPGDLRVDGEGTAHLAWHDHNAPGPRYGRVSATGGVSDSVIDTPYHDGWDNALAIGPDDGVHQSSIYPSTFGASDSLQYGSLTDTGWVYEVSIPGSGGTMYGLGTSLAVDTHGFAHIAYGIGQSWTDPGDLMYARGADGSWQISTIVSNGIRGRFPSLAVDAEDRPHVAWMDIDSFDPGRGIVRYGVLDHRQWQIEEVDVLNSVKLGFSEARRSISLALTDAGLPCIAYADAASLWYAERHASGWVRTNVVWRPDRILQGLAVLRIDASGRPAIAFWQSDPDTPGLIRMARPVPPPFALDAAVVAAAGDALHLEWPPVTGARFTVQQRALGPGTFWFAAPGAWPRTATQWDSPGLDASAQLYRVVISPTP